MTEIETLTNVVCQPRGSWVLVQRDKQKKKTEGGLILPEGVGSDFDTGTVLAVGPGNASISGGRQLDTEGLEPGTRVMFRASVNVQVRGPVGPMQGKKPQTLPFKVNGEKVELIPEHEIIATLENETNE